MKRFIWLYLFLTSLIAFKADIVVGSDNLLAEPMIKSASAAVIGQSINETNVTMTAPPNDLCENAEPIVSPFPATGYGSTIDATVDCPALFNWDGVWFTIELPYDINNITITICGLTEDLDNTGIALTDDCACDDYIAVDGLTPLVGGECPSGFNGYEMTFDNVPGNLNDEGVVYWPALAENGNSENMDFAYTINVTEGEPPPAGDTCEDPILIPGLPFSDILNSCDFNNDYNFGGKDAVYSFAIDTCLIVTISLCNTDPIFDTYLLLYDGSCGVMPIANDDDACMAPNEVGTSEIIDTLHAGQYYILVDAYGGECGPYVMDVTGVECEVLGACCVGPECTGTMSESECDMLAGDWFAFQDCSQGFACPGTCYDYLPGDVNMSIGAWPPAAIGSDVTYLVNFFRGLPSSSSCIIDGFWASADANGDCNIISSDVTKLVNFFRGITSLQHCPDYEPCWPTFNDLPDDAPPDWPGCE